MNGETPYFRFYADSWRARLAGLPATTQALVLQVAAIGWAEKKGAPVKLSTETWERLCGMEKGGMDSAIIPLTESDWIQWTEDCGTMTFTIPDLAGQAKLVTYERDKKRAQRAKEEGPSPGRIDRGSELRKSERQAAPRSAGPVVPAPVASDEERHAILQAAIGRIGRMPQ